MELKKLHEMSFDEAEKSFVQIAAHKREKYALNYAQCLDLTAKDLGFNSFNDLHLNLRSNCINSV